MKKYYYMVLVALFSLALNAFAQEDKWETVTAPSGTEAQDEDYNMVITLPDGTTVTVNTDDVDEVQFSNGKVTLSGTSIQQLLEYCEKIQAEQDKLIGTIHALVDDESILHVLLEDNKRAYEELQDYVTDLANKLDTLNVSGDAQIAQATADNAQLAAQNAQIAADAAKRIADNALKLAEYLEGKLNQYATDASALVGKVDGLSTRLTMVEGVCSTLSTDVNEALNEAKQALYKVKVNEDETNNLKNMITALQGKDTALDDEISELRATIADLKSQLNSQGNNGSGINGHAYVEIGGLKWATMNVGATTVAGSYATCYGDYYAWGETQPRYASITRSGTGSASFSWKNGYSSGYSSDNFPTYTGTTLDASHDAAAANWGGTWRTPKYEDFMALAKACTGSDGGQRPVELTSAITSGGIYWLSSTQTIESAYTGVAGLLFVSASDISKRVFFPASGRVYDTSLFNGGTYGYSWSSSLYTSNTYSAYYLLFDSSRVGPSGNDYRYNGFTVRPVSD